MVLTRGGAGKGECFQDSGLLLNTPYLEPPPHQPPSAHPGRGSQGTRQGQAGESLLPEGLGPRQSGRPPPQLLPFPLCHHRHHFLSEL